MVPLNRSMFIDYGSSKESYSQPQQFMFGDLLLAAPVTTPGVGDDLTASQKVWFPSGETWYDYFTHEQAKSGVTDSIAKPLDEFPLYVRGGWLLPMQPYTPRPATAALDTLVLRVYPAGKDVDNVFTLYEDDGISLDYTKGVYRTTALRYSQQGDKAVVTVHPAEGSYPGEVTKRGIRLQLPGLQEGAVVKVNGRKAKVGYDAAHGCPVVEIAPSHVSKKNVIEYSI